MSIERTPAPSRRPGAPTPLVLLPLLVSLPLTAPTAAAGQTVPGARVDSIFREMDGPARPGCAVSVMRDGAPIYQRGYGMANLEYGVPITPRSVFHVASVSKQFTAMAVELLVEEGKVSWDDPIREYVPEVPDFDEEMTLRHLVHHVSGIRDQWNLLSMAGWRWEADVVTQKDVLEITSRQEALNFPPGTRYLYSNTGFTLLAVVVERVAGESLRDFARARIFEPLGMQDTHFHDDHEMIVPERAYAYEPDSAGAFGYRISIPDFDVVGATSLFTTVRDLAAWDRNFRTGRVGGEAALERLRSRYVLASGDTIDYAHGISHGSYRGLPTLGHGGADAGYRSQFLRFPGEGLGVAVLCNFPSSGPGTLARRVADIFLEGRFPEAGAPEGDPSAEPAGEVVLEPEELRRLAGVYRAPRGDAVLRLVVDDDTLKLDVGRTFPLRPLGDHRFRVVGAGVEVTLRPPEEGRRGTLRIGDDGDDDLYRRLDPWSPSPGELAGIAGSYRSVELGTTYRFAVEDGSLRFHHRKLPSKELEPAFRDAFTMDGRTLVFSRDEAGTVDGFRISDGRVWGVRFSRVGDR